MILLNLLSTLDGEIQPFLTYQDEQNFSMMGLLLGVITYMLEWAQITNACQRPRSIQTTTVVVKAWVRFMKLSTNKIMDHHYLRNVYQHNIPCTVCCTSRPKLFMLPSRDECPTT